MSLLRPNPKIFTPLGRPLRRPLGPPARGAAIASRLAQGTPFSAFPFPAPPLPVIFALAVITWALLHSRRRRLTHERELTLAWLESHTDPLTGLPNRALVHDLLDAQNHPDQYPDDFPDGVVMLVLLDLDGFKQVNDTYGHDVGDDLLVEISARLADMTLDDYTVRAGLARPVAPARLAGDEFVLLWPDLPPDPTAQVERLLGEVAEPAHLHGVRLDIGISAGVAVAGPHLHGPDLLRAADAAMYEAKRNTPPPAAEPTNTTENDDRNDRIDVGAAGRGRVTVRLWSSDRPPTRPAGPPGQPARRAARDTRPAAPHAARSFTRHVSALRPSTPTEGSR